MKKSSLNTLLWKYFIDQSTLIVEIDYPDFLNKGYSKSKVKQALAEMMKDGKISILDKEYNFAIDLTYQGDRDGFWLENGCPITKTHNRIFPRLPKEVT